MTTVGTANFEHCQRLVTSSIQKIVVSHGSLSSQLTTPSRNITMTSGDSDRLPNTSIGTFSSFLFRSLRFKLFGVDELRNKFESRLGSDGVCESSIYHI
jgi:hypothetical protein